MTNSTNALTNSIYQLELIFNMNERLFLNALDGITDQQAKERISENNNPLIWIATHTVWARYNILVFLGKPLQNPYAGMFENFRPYDKNDDYPALVTLKDEWIKVSALLRDAIRTVSDEDLAADSPLKSPIGDYSNAGTIAFLAQHESYDIGQVGFLKKYFTKEAMKYN